MLGKRVRPRAMERTDLRQLQECLNDPEVAEGLSLHVSLSAAEEEKWLVGVMEGLPEERPLALEIRQGDAWQLAGNPRLFNPQYANRSAEFGIFLGDKSKWNHG